MRSILVLVTLAAVGACSSTSTSSDGEPTPTRTDGGSTSGNGAGAPDTGSPAEIVATAECDAMAKCDVYGMSVTYGDYATCVQRRTLANGSAFSAPKHAWVDAASARACAAALAAEACHNGVLGNRHHVDAPRPIGGGGMLAEVRQRRADQSGAFPGRDRFFGRAKAIAAPGAHFHKDQRIGVLQHQIEFARGAAPVAITHVVALRGQPPRGHVFA